MELEDLESMDLSHMDRIEITIWPPRRAQSKRIFYFGSETNIERRGTLIPAIKCYHGMFSPSKLIRRYSLIPMDDIVKLDTLTSKEEFYCLTQ